MPQSDCHCVSIGSGVETKQQQNGELDSLLDIFVIRPEMFVMLATKGKNKKRLSDRVGGTMTLIVKNWTELKSTGDTTGIVCWAVGAGEY